MGSACVVSAAALAVAADAVADALAARVRAGVAADVADIRGVTCMESVDRIRYAPRRPNGTVSCSDLLGAATVSPRGAAEWRSRLRLDVTAGPASDKFAFTNASIFERNDLEGILSAAATGSGEFSSFLRDLSALDARLFQSRGVQQTSLGPLLAFGFAAPGGSSLAGYHGVLFANPATGELKRLTLQFENMQSENIEPKSDGGATCRVQYTTDFSATRVGNREIILPLGSTMETLNRDGTELHSEAYYSGCRNPEAGVKPPTAASARNPVPPNLRLKVRFEPEIDSETAATGDPVTGVIRTTLKDKQKGIIVHAGDRLHGRIASIGEYLTPTPRWVVAIVFATIERGVGENGIDQGVEQPVSLAPLDDGERIPRHEELDAEQLQKLRPRGGGYFVFRGPKAVLADTEWETR